MKKKVTTIFIVALIAMSFAALTLPINQNEVYAAPNKSRTSSAIADNTRPQISISSPTDKSVVPAGKIVVTGSAFDQGTGVKWVGVKVDSNHYVADALAISSGFADWSAVLTITTPGTYRLTARADDFAGNIMWAHVYVTVVSSTITKITVTPPSDITAQATGVTTPISLGSPTVTVYPSESLQVTNNAPSGFKLGTTTVTWTASDAAGNKATGQQLVNIVDTKQPTVVVTLPLNGSKMPAVPFTVTVQGTSSDSGTGVAFVEVGARLPDSTVGQDYVMASTGDNWKTWSASLTVTNSSFSRIIARATDNAGNNNWSSTYLASVTQSPSPPSSDTSGTGSGTGTGTGSSGTDKFGITELYPTKTGGNEWFVNMNDPKSDPTFRNLPTMIKQIDGSWQVSATQVRMEAWSPSNQKWLNVEITEYAKIVGGTNQLLQLYSRGGHHSATDPCLGSAVKARLYGDGEAKWVKEITHPAYTGSKGTVQATTDSLQGRWVGFKAVIYNFVENGKTYVRMESYIDDDVTDSNGNLVVKNNWKLASVAEDRGGWGTTNTDFASNCSPNNKDSTQQYRQRDEILNMSGGTSTQNIAAWRSDDLTWNWKYLSVREIEAP